MGESVGLNERRQLRRWLAAVGLTTAAEEAARVDTAETNAIALLSAHTACEVLIGLLAGVRPYKLNDDPRFDDLMKSAADNAGSFDSGLTDHLRAMHRVRNGFVHASNTVAADEAARAISNARRLMELVPASFGASWTLPEGAGVGSAVAEIIAIEAVAAWLRFADQILRLQPLRPDLAADGLARALDSALSRTRPPLLPGHWFSVGSHRVGFNRYANAPADRALQELDRWASEMDRRADAMDKRTAGLFAWVLPLALGTSPIAYQRLREIIGWAYDETMGLGPGKVFRETESPPSQDAVRQAISQTSEIIFRLWAIGSLESQSGDEKIVEAIRAFIDHLSPAVAEPEGA